MTLTSVSPNSRLRPWLADFIGYQLRRVSSQSIAELEATLAELDLRTVHYTVLSTVQRLPGVTQNEISREVNMRSSNLVPILRDLDRRRLIVRRPDSTDGRLTRISLEPAGEAILDDLHRRVLAHEERFFGVLSADEKAELMQLLRRLGSP